MRILLVDDHALVLDGISSLLEASGYEVVGLASDCQTAITLALDLKPDVVLMDISMPRMSGIDALSRIKKQSPDTKVAMLTASETESDLLAALHAGADGYILKSANADELLQKIDAVGRGELAMSSRVASRAVQSLVRGTSEAKASAKIALSEREAGILALVANGMANRAIGAQLEISENTVKYHLKKVMNKLDAQNRTEAVAYAMRLNLLPKR